MYTHVALLFGNYLDTDRDKGIVYLYTYTPIDSPSM